MKTTTTILIYSSIFLLMACDLEEDGVPIPEPSKHISAEDLGEFLSDTVWTPLEIIDVTNSEIITDNYIGVTLEFGVSTLANDEFKVTFMSNTNDDVFPEEGAISFATELVVISNDVAIRSDGAELDFSNLLNNIQVDTILEYTLSKSAVGLNKNINAAYEYQVKLTRPTRK